MDQDTCPDSVEAKERNMSIDDCAEYKPQPACPECATLKKRLGTTKVIYCPNCGDDNREEIACQAKTM